MFSPTQSQSDARYELKLVCPQIFLDQARSWLRLHPEGFRVAHPAQQVNSIYLDTPDLRHMNANMMGVSDRVKLRIRWYGPLMTSVLQPTLELKKRDGYLGSKKRQTLACTLDLEELWHRTIRQLRAAAGDDWRDEFRPLLHPAVIVHYQREYFETRDGLIRATLDYDQAAYDQRLAQRPNLRRRTPLSPDVIIELKAGPAEFQRLQAIVGHFPIRRSRNSKYVRAMLANG